MKPDAIRNTGLFSKSGNKKSIFINSTIFDSVPLNELITIYTDDGYAEIIIPSESIADLLSGLSELHCNKLNDFAGILNSSELLSKHGSPFNKTGRIYVSYYGFSDGIKENINDAGYIPELTATDYGFCLKH